MRVKLSVTLDVEAVEDKGMLADTPRVLRSVREGIEHAIRYGQGEGFVHEMSEDVSIMLADVGEAIEEPAIQAHMIAVLNDVLDTETKLTANVEIKADGIFLSVGERVVALLENKSGTPQVVVYADALRDDPTHVVPIPNKTPCIRVEYDLDFAGGNYSGVGQFAYIPLKDIGHAPDAVEAAFERVTGHDRVHIIHYSTDETFDEDGNPWRHNRELCLDWNNLQPKR